MTEDYTPCSRCGEVDGHNEKCLSHPPDIDHEYTRLVTCPYCGWEEQDSWEIPVEEGGHYEMECGRCDRMFVVTKQIDVTYSTLPEGRAR